MSSSSTSMGHAKSTNSTSSSQDETLRLHNRDAWLRWKIKCMCDRCRGCFFRARRITMSHLSMYGEWDQEKDPVIFSTLFAQILLVYVASSPFKINLIFFIEQDAVPHPQMVPPGRREAAKRRREEAESSRRVQTDDDDSSPHQMPHQVLEEEILDNMVHDLFSLEVRGEGASR